MCHLAGLHNQFDDLLSLPLLHRCLERLLARGRPNKGNCQVAAHIRLRFWLLRCFQGFEKFSGVGGGLAEKLGIPKLNFQILRRTMATRAQKMGSVKDIQAHLRHAKADTTANEYMQELPESVKQMVGSVYAMLSTQHEPRKGSVLLLPNRARKTS